MRTFLVWLLLAFAPFIGVRLVCIERPAAGPAESGGESSAHCDEFCPRPPATALGGSKSEVDCLFLADGVLLMVVDGLAVLPTPPSVRFESVSLSVNPEQHDLYLAPFLTHHNPPPKA